MMNNSVKCQMAHSKIKNLYNLFALTVNINGSKKTTKIYPVKMK